MKFPNEDNLENTPKQKRINIHKKESIFKRGNTLMFYTKRRGILTQTSRRFIKMPRCFCLLINMNIYSKRDATPPKDKQKL